MQLCSSDGCSFITADTQLSDIQLLNTWRFGGVQTSSSKNGR